MTLSERLEQQIPEILRQWETRARAGVPAARHVSRPVLLNKVPEFLEELAASLTGPTSTYPPPQTPKEHAKQRAEHPEYSLEEVIREYGLLERTILDVLWPLEHAEVSIILDLLQASVAEAVTHYVELQHSALLNSERRFKLLVSGVKDYAIYILDTAGRVVDWNEGAERLIGYSAEEIIGQSYDRFYTEAEQASGLPTQHLKAAAQDGRIELAGLRVRKDGTEFFAHTVLAAIYDSTGALTGYSKVIRDITERRAMELELQRHVDALADSNRRKDEFLAVLSHELRNPLAPIMAGVELLQRRQDRNGEEREVIETIGRQGRYLVRLVDDLLDVARITHGKIILQKEPLELTHVLSQVAETVRPFATDRGLELAVSLPGEGVWLEADATRLSQVFANLLHNSIKFTDRGGRVELRAWIEARCVRVEVSDTGVGIDPTTLPNLFNIFVQGAQPVDRIVNGLGIGLALVRMLVELHDGSVTAASEGAGKGSRFVVSLPVQRVEKREPGPTERDAERTFSPARILVADDNRDAVETIVALLRACGHEVSIAYDGQQAIRQATADPPDAVVLDIGLPDMNGYEVAQRLREDPKLRRTRLIALSGYGREEDKHRSLEAGFDSHLTKPASLGALQKAISGETGAL